jgi:hypothetical protein
MKHTKTYLGGLGLLAALTLVTQASATTLYRYEPNPKPKTLQPYYIDFATPSGEDVPILEAIADIAITTPVFFGLGLPTIPPHTFTFADLPPFTPDPPGGIPNIISWDSFSIKGPWALNFVYWESEDFFVTAHVDSAVTKFFFPLKYFPSESGVLTLWQPVEAQVPVKTPDTGSTLAMLGMSLVGLVLVRTRARARTA